MRESVKKSFTLRGSTSEHASGIRGIVGAYALINPAMVLELQSMARGELLRHVQADFPTWSFRTPVRKYWNCLVKHFPAFAECLRVNFSYILVASTVVEQQFSCMNSQVHTNDANETIQRNANYTVNVKQSTTTEMRYLPSETADGEEAAHGQPKYRRPLRNKPDRLLFLRILQKHVKRIELEHRDDVASVRQFRGKRKREIEQQGPRVHAEMEMNAVHENRRLGAEEIEKTMQEFTHCAIHKKPKLASSEKTAYEKECSNKYWKVDTIRAYLKAADPGKFNDLSKVKKHTGKKDCKNYENLQVLLVQYWEENNVSIETIHALYTVQ